MKSEVGAHGKHQAPGDQVGKKENLNRKREYWRRDWECGGFGE